MPVLTRCRTWWWLVLRDILETFSLVVEHTWDARPRLHGRGLAYFSAPVAPYQCNPAADSQPGAAPGPAWRGCSTQRELVAQNPVRDGAHCWRLRVDRPGLPLSRRNADLVCRTSGLGTWP